ncbi:MAG: hypothetical protein QOJ41_2889, partial [Acidobacteriaceae bacterium]|nr:hypothetical protein [Acidobacteriaceae bacterium]
MAVHCTVSTAIPRECLVTWGERDPPATLTKKA